MKKRMTNTKAKQTKFIIVTIMLTVFVYAITPNMMCFAETREMFRTAAIGATLELRLNHRPEFSPLEEEYNGTEGEEFLIPSIAATDPDDDYMTMEMRSLPILDGVIFSQSDSQKGYINYELRWSAEHVTAGEYSVEFKATDDRGAPTYKYITISILGPGGNHAPVLNPIGNQESEEGTGLDFVIPKITATDQDGDPITITAENLPPRVKFFQIASDAGSVTYKLRWPYQYITAGTYVTKFTASDGQLTDEETITISILGPGGNHGPAINPIGNWEGEEGIEFVIPSITATDAEGNDITMAMSGLPETAQFNQLNFEPGSVEYELRWPAASVTGGTYIVKFTASDGQITSSQTVTISILGPGGNHFPVLNPIGNQESEEGTGLDFVIPKITATDEDGDPITITAENLPPRAKFFQIASDAGSVTYKLRWPYQYITAGIYEVTFIASDGQLTDSETITIYILGPGGNHFPVLNPIGNQESEEGTGLDFIIPKITATDEDGDPITITAENLPPRARFFLIASDVGSVTYKLRWEYKYVTAGTYVTKFIASDGQLTNEETITISILGPGGNHGPAINPIGNHEGEEGIEFVIPSITATDAEGNDITMAMSGLPETAQFNQLNFEPGSVEYELRWPAASVTGGTYIVKFTASDGQITSSQTVTISILGLGGNHFPVLNPIGDREGQEGLIFAIARITATDQDGDPITITAENLPPRASFFQTSTSNLGSVEYKLRWLDRYVTAGTYNVTFVASDGTLRDEETIKISIRGVLSVATSPETGKVPLYIQFQTELSEGWTPTCTWYFGDGNQDIGESVGYIYDFPGDYQVILEASDGIANSNRTKMIRVFEDEAPVNLGKRALFVWNAWDAGDGEGWIPQGGLKGFDIIGDGTINTAVTSPDAYMEISELSINTSLLKRVSVSYKITGANPLEGKLSWRKAGYANFEPANSQSFSIIDDGVLHTYDLDLSSHPEWKGTVVGLRFYPTTGSTGHAWVDSIKVQTPSPSPDDINWEFNPGGKGIINDPVKRQELLDFCYVKGITLIFLNSQGVVYGDGFDIANYNSFITEAHNSVPPISVYGLQGRPWWSIPAIADVPAHLSTSEGGWQYLEAIINHAQFNGFDGIIDDTEPYVVDVDGWNNNTQQRADWYLEWIKGCKDRASATPFISVIPFWFDNQEYELVLNGETTPRHLYKHVSDIAGSVCIMDYRDFADPTRVSQDDLITHIENELNYRSGEIPCWIAVEVQNCDFDKISFYEETENYMEQELSELKTYYDPVDDPNDNYEGIAIHYYIPYKWMNH